MVQRIPDAYGFDPADPRAPTEAQWEGMSDAERARVVAMLPAEGPIGLEPPEGDFHWKAKAKTRDTLDDFFRRIGRKIYVSSELTVFYPGEARFAPDVLAVLDTEHKDRTKWVVADEGKGLDLVIEVHYAGHRKKDHVENVARYARLGIHEYFVFDRRRLTLHGFRLPKENERVSTKARVYRPILAQGGLFQSEVLGLDLTIDGTKLRFFYGMAPVPEADELIATLQTMVDDLLGRLDEAERHAAREMERAAEEAARATEEAARAVEEATRADELERRLVRSLRREVEAICERLAIEVGPTQRAQLDGLGADGIEELLSALREARRWP